MQAILGGGQQAKDACNYFLNNLKEGSDVYLSFTDNGWRLGLEMDTRCWKTNVYMKVILVDGPNG